MGILDRMSRLIRANINDMIDRAEDPEKMLNELMREMQGSIREARQQVANMIAQEKLVEAELQEAQMDAREWERKAELAIQRDREDLAREALRRKRDAEEIASVYATQLASQQELVDKLRNQLKVLERKYEEAESKRNLLIARHRRAQAQRRITETFSSLPDMSAMGELERMERRILSEEAHAAAMQELEEGDVEWQFAELESEPDVEAELLALKARISGNEPALTEGSTASQSDDQ
ncbi:MAG TPA: PspA/IM30 family protein [Thermomicrobiales bacterium]|nr:PspA/IM30 family protein [Thermomicrobiales bacterium]